jgi:hypothetical protein
VLLATAVIAWPPAIAPDGGWRAAERDGAAIHAFAGGTPYALVGIPEFKNLNAVRFPLERLGARPPGPEVLDGPNAPALLGFVCDPLFAEVVGAPCGGPAEAAWLEARGLDLPLVETWTGGARRTISFYGSR